MNAASRGFRRLAAVLIATLAIGLAAPERAEALEPLTIVAIAGVAVVVVIIVAYLIVANMSDSRRRADQAAPSLLACLESDVALRNCWAIPEPSDPGPAPVAPLAAAVQGP